MLRLGCASTNFCTGQGLSHTFLSVCGGLGAGMDVRLIVPGCLPGLRDPRMVEAVPRAFGPLIYKNNSAVRLLTERRLLTELNDLDAVYTFPAVSPAAVKQIQQRGKPIVLERVSCAQRTAKHILDDAYHRLDLPPTHGIGELQSAAEADEVSRANYLVCPSPYVVQSFLDIGVSPDKLIASSYGWAPARFGELVPRQTDAELFTVLFVGRVSVGKGAHLLLAAWERANLKGRLILCGNLEPALARSCQAILARPDVIHQPYTRDISAFYQQANVFAFPSLIEGSPLVTYEAMAHGLPLLVSPMAAGSVVRDGIEGRVLEPYDEEAWVAALRELAQDPARRTAYGAAARKRANEFTWEQVAKRRGAMLAARLSGLAHE